MHFRLEVLLVCLVVAFFAGQITGTKSVGREVRARSLAKWEQIKDQCRSPMHMQGVAYPDDHYPRANLKTLCS